MPDLADLRIHDVLDAVSSSRPTPGGGSVAALVAALGVSLGAMAASIRTARDTSDEASALADQFARYRGAFLQLAAADEAAFENVMTAFRLPSTEPSKPQKLETALQEAAEIPLQMAARGLEALADLEQMAPLATQHTVSDVGAAAHLISGALHATLLNVDINVRMMKDAQVSAQLTSRREKLSRQCHQQLRLVAEAVDNRLTG